MLLKAIRMTPLLLWGAVLFTLPVDSHAQGTPEEVNPGLPVAVKPTVILGAAWKAPEVVTDAAVAGAATPPPPPAAAAAAATESTTEAPPESTPETVLPPPAPEFVLPGVGLMTEYPLQFPGFDAKFNRPEGAGPLSLFRLEIDWSSPEAQALLKTADDGALEKFLRSVDGTVRAGGDSVRLMITPPPATPAGAVFLKKISSSVRGATKEARFGLLFSDAAAVAQIPPLYDLELAPYIDGWWTFAEGLTPATARVLFDLRQQLDLTAELGITGLPLKAQLSAAPLAAGLSNGFRLFIFVPQPKGAKYLSALRALIPAGAIGVDPEGKGAAVLGEGEEKGKKLENLVFAKLFDDKDDTELLFFYIPEQPAKAIVELELPTADVREATLLVPLHDAEFPLALTSRDERKDITRAAAYARGEPFFVRYKRFELQRLKGELAKLEAPGRKETVSVRAKYQIPVDELIKRYQAFQAGQDFRLENYTAEATVHYLWGIGAGAGSINVTFLNNFFFARKSGATWEQTEMRVEGLPWTGRDIPELPIPQPEKVNSVPLDISFGKQYRYSLAGEEMVEGRKAWKVRFEPLDRSQALYDGTLWIDQQMYARLKVSAVQTGLKAPMLSSDDTTFYAPLPAPDGGDIWVMSRISGQQTFSAAGLTLKAQRTVEFAKIVLNPPDYAGSLAAAEAGDNHMLKETDAGLKYFEKGKDGVRAPRDARTRRWLLGGALFSDPSIDVAGSKVIGGIALDMLDTDFLGRDYQFNMLLAGVYNNLVFANPHLFGSRVTFTTVANLTLLKSTDRLYSSGTELALEQVAERSQQGIVALSRPLGNYLNGRLGVAVETRQFFGISPKDKDKDGIFEGTGAGFATPANHLQTSFYGQLDFTRRGWGAAAEVELFGRSKWRAWGTPAQQAYFNPDEKNFLKWNVELGKDFPLPRYQRISAGLVWLDGARLDRFSSYRFSFFGQRKLPGFSGSGVRFDQGWIVDGGYGFTLGEAVRIGADLGYARVRSKDQTVRGTLIRGEDWTNHAGVGLSANFITHKKFIKFLPQNSLVRFEIGYAASSDYKPVQGNLTYTLAILKLLK